MNKIIALFVLVSLMGFSLAQGEAVAQIATNEAQKSPWGSSDEISTLNMMTDASRLDVLKRIAGGKVYDLGVDLFPGMPYCCGPFGDPNFQIFMTHAPGRDPSKELLSYLVMASPCIFTAAPILMRLITSGCTGRSGTK